MLLISQNIKNYYNFKLPDDVVLRINLAWCNSLDELEKINSNVYQTEAIGNFKL
jgi:hypothetical protein